MTLIKNTAIVLVALVILYFYIGFVALIGYNHWNRSNIQTHQLALFQQNSCECKDPAFRGCVNMKASGLAPLREEFSARSAELQMESFVALFPRKLEELFIPLLLIEFFLLHYPIVVPALAIVACSCFVVLIVCLFLRSRNKAQLELKIEDFQAKQRKIIAKEE